MLTKWENQHIFSVVSSIISANFSATEHSSGEYYHGSRAPDVWEKVEIHMH